jgi:hypothetical protein
LEGSGNSTSDDKNTLSGSKFRQSLPPKDTRQWLYKNPFFKGNFPGQYKHPSIDIDFWNTDIFGKTSWIEIGPPQCVAKGMKTIQAVLAGITGNMMRNEHPVTHLIPSHSTSNFNDLSHLDIFDP